MANTFQQQSLRRKLLYIFLILVLFTATLAFRQAKVYGLDAQAGALEIRDMDQGEVELTGSALRLTLTGSRGLAVCILWQSAINKQMKHEWNELELLVNSLTKLQPYFVTPWLFQSWNLSYNVSVESDRIQDKYFYIARGIELLADGERQNRNNPDLRFWMGFYNQHKIGLSDEANTFRCLYQLSCIDPIERDPARMRTVDQNGNNVVDEQRFEEFCQHHPMLIRRLREALKNNSREDILAFLTETSSSLTAGPLKIPSRYEDKPSGTSQGSQPTTDLKPVERQFPALPPLGAEGTASMDRADPNRIDFDNFLVARDWYIYSNQPLPKPTPRLNDKTQPADASKGERIPHGMSSVLFRQKPARAQSYVAEYLEKEGWFGAEGWRITGGLFPDDKFQNGADAVVGEGINWAHRAWQKAFDMNSSFGTATGLYLDAEAMKTLNDRAKKYRKQFSLADVARPVDLPEQWQQDPEMKASFEAHSQLYWYNSERQLTNFAYFYFRSQVEQEEQTIAIRRAFFEAEQLRKAANREQALQKYTDALQKWTALLLTHEGFRRDLNVQEDTFEVVVKYLDLIKQLHGKRLRALLLAQDVLGRGAMGSPVGATLIAAPILGRDMPLPVVTPVDRVDEHGLPLISDQAKSNVWSRMGLLLNTSRR